MDLILGRFADAHLEAMLDSDLDLFEQLLDVPDTELYKWIAGQARIPPNHDTPMYQALIAYQTANPTAPTT